MVHATLTMDQSGATDKAVARILKGASTVVDVQYMVGTSESVIHLFGVVDLDGEVVKVQIKSSNGATNATIYYDANNAIPKLEILEFSDS